jgi:hypothetical protein
VRFLSLEYSSCEPETPVPLYLCEPQSLKKEKVSLYYSFLSFLTLPINRVLRLEEVDEKTKEALLKLRASINIIELAEQIEYLTEELSAAYEKKPIRSKKHG